jgi:hypothetical protein
MNGKLIFQLSLFGLAMGLATVFVISSTVEPIFWLVIFVVCAYLIGRHAGGRYFLHGLLLGVLNSVWVTGAHVLLFDQYVANHPAEAEMMTSMPLSPKLMMVLVGPFIGLASGCVLGLFALVASKLQRKP